jgi:hypothetical protein
MQFKKILSALLLVLVAWLQVGLPAMAAGVAGRVQLTENKQLQRYVCSSGPITPESTPTALFSFKGSASKTIYIDRVEMSYSCSGITSGVAETFYLKKRSTANSGGTSTTVSPVPLDSSSSAASASGLVCYTADPSSLGTAVGDVKVFPVHASQVYNSGHHGQNQAQMQVFDAVSNHSPIVLRGTAESIEINFNGATVQQTTPRMWCTVFFSEE